MTEQLLPNGIHNISGVLFCFNIRQAGGATSTVHLLAAAALTPRNQDRYQSVDHLGKKCLDVSELAPSDLTCFLGYTDCFHARNSVLY